MQPANRLFHFLRRHKLALVLILAVLLRLIFLVLLADTLRFGDGAVHGSVAYDDLARNLLETGIYGRTPGVADSVLPPLYSIILAGIYAVFGRGFVQIALFHILLDLLSIILLDQICRRLFRQAVLWGVPAGEWVGTLAGLFYAAYPYLIFQNLTLNDTALWIVLLHSFVLLLIVLRERPTFDRMTLVWAILAGAVLGLATLTRAL
ncbi:MAG: glycosyltransferase family 39 protein, partial [Anaerolineae bacterium]|nr:glycosyltransferase family 39 protein [Anaerolineae bacterium]